MIRPALTGMFERWCLEEGVRHRISAHKPATALRERGVTDGGKVGIDRFWSGLRFRNEQERIAAERALSGHAGRIG